MLLVDVKKTYRADLDNRRVSGFLLGLVVALSLFLVALEFTTRGGMPEADEDVLDDVSQDIEMMPAVHHDDMIAAAPSGRQAAVSDKINVVDKPVKEEKAGNLLSDKAALKKLLGVGFGDIAAVSDVTLQPTAVNGDAENGYTIELKHSDNFSTVMSGLTHVYFAEGDSVLTNVPLAYTDGTHPVRVTFYEEGNLLDCVTVEGGTLAWS